MYYEHGIQISFQLLASGEMPWNEEESLNKVHIVSARCSTIGTFPGSQNGASPADFGMEVIKAVFADAKVKPEQADELLCGNILSASLGQHIDLNGKAFAEFIKGFKDTFDASITADVIKSITELIGKLSLQFNRGGRLRALLLSV